MWMLVLSLCTGGWSTSAWDRPGTCLAVSYETHPYISEEECEGGAFEAQRRGRFTYLWRGWIVDRYVDVNQVIGYRCLAPEKGGR